jgi:deazaflavin-dependent oxidoreductase (nitroreductase family)
MPEKIRELKPPRGLGRFFLRFPVALYRVGFGWLFGDRLLLLNHIGRNSGKQRQAVLEVAHHDRKTNTYIVNVGFGKSSDWYQNIKKNPDVSIVAGRNTIDVQAEDLPPEEGGEIMVDFFRKHPVEARMAGFIGYRVKNNERDFRELGEELSFVRLTPRSIRQTR